MLAKILVPLDGSPQAAAAVPLARTFIRSSPSVLTLVRVVEEPSSVRFSASDEARSATAYLERIAAELAGKHHVTVESRVLLGRPANEIVRLAEEVHACLVVMATHSRNGVSRLLPGSVAEQVVADSPVPVALVRPGGRRVARIRTLLVPVDGSPGGNRALAAATRLAREHAARIELVTVIPGMPGYLQEPLPGIHMGRYLMPTWEAARQDALAMVDRIVHRLGRHGISTAGHALVGGDVAHAIVRTAGEVSADVVVVSTHALVGPARSVLGSVAGAIVRDAGRPVLLVRRRAGASLGGGGDESRGTATLGRPA
jgi:nucleotide-binding universal stress UspA family protein